MSVRFSSALGLYNVLGLCVLQVTKVGKAFAEKYTGFSNSVSAQLSLVELSLQRDTLASLLSMGTKLKTAIDRSAGASFSDPRHLFQPHTARTGGVLFSLSSILERIFGKRSEQFFTLVFHTN